MEGLRSYVGPLPEELELWAIQKLVRVICEQSGGVCLQLSGESQKCLRPPEVNKLLF